MTETTRTIKCDKCGKKLKRQGQPTKVDRTEIVHELWTEFHVSVIFRDGANSHFKDREADLCQVCRDQLTVRAVRRNAQQEN
jgi:rRNA maturation endonuclease Nob1